MLRDLPVSIKISLSGLLITGIAAALIGYLTLIQIKQTMELEALRKLGSVEKIVKHEFQLVADNYAADLIVTAKNRAVADVMQEFSSAYGDLEAANTDVPELLKKAYIDTGAGSADQIGRLAGAKDGKSYAEAHDRWQPWFREFAQLHGYYDVFLVDPEGRVVFSAEKEGDFGTDLVSRRWRDSGLAEVIAKSMSGSTSDIVSFSGFKPYEPSAGDLAGFISHAVFNEQGDRIGTLAFQLLDASFVDSINQDTGINGRVSAYVMGQDWVPLFSNDSHKEAFGFSGGEIHYEMDLVKSAFASSDITLVDTHDDGEKFVESYGGINLFGTKYVLVWEIPYDDIMASTYALIWKVLGIVLVCTAGLATSMHFIVRSIVLPLNKLLAGLAKISETRDLSIRVGSTANDEVGRSTKAVDNILGMVEGFVREAKFSADQLEDTAKGMESSARSMSNSSEEQATSVEELSSSLEEAEAQSSYTANAAARATEAVSSAAQIALVGKQHIQKMSDAMDEISGSSHDIAKIIKVIDEIAFQTNILALNASV